MDRTDHVPEQPTPPLPQPSNARRLMQAMAVYMEQPGNRGRLLTRVGVQRALAQAAEQTLSALPDAEADEALDRVTATLPDRPPSITHGTYGQLLRQTAETL